MFSALLRQWTSFSLKLCMFLFLSFLAVYYYLSSAPTGKQCLVLLLRGLGSLKSASSWSTKWSNHILYLFIVQFISNVILWRNLGHFRGILWLNIVNILSLYLFCLLLHLLGKKSLSLSDSRSLKSFLKGTQSLSQTESSIPLWQTLSLLSDSFI